MEKLSYRRLCEGTTSDFIKTSLLSPDGLHCLALSESNFLTNWTVPRHLLTQNLYYPTQNELENSPDLDSIEFEGAYGVGESVYDYAWYPHMNTSIPATCCFITTSRDHPIQLWDMNSG